MDFKGVLKLTYRLGAFTPGCSVRHLPGYIEKYSVFKEKGVDVVAVIATNDAWVVRVLKAITHFSYLLLSKYVLQLNAYSREEILTRISLTDGRLEKSERSQRGWNRMLSISHTRFLSFGVLAASVARSSCYPIKIECVRLTLSKDILNGFRDCFLEEDRLDERS